MKNYLILTIAVLLLFSCSQAQDNKNTEIYVTVIKEIPTDTVIDIKNYIKFSDDRGSKPALGDSLEIFTSIVNPGKKVKWKKGKNSLQTVKITEVNFKEVTGSENILEKTKMKGKYGVVKGKVKPKGSVDPNTIEFYSITFEIDNVEYTIDPKLEYH